MLFFSVEYVHNDWALPVISRHAYTMQGNATYLPRTCRVTTVLLLELLRLFSILLLLVQRVMYLPAFSVPSQVLPLTRHSHPPLLGVILLYGLITAGNHGHGFPGSTSNMMSALSRCSTHSNTLMQMNTTILMCHVRLHTCYSCRRLPAS
jgi:hypothetical protein